MMKLHELIAEIERRGIKISFAEDDRLKVEPLSECRELLDEMKKRRDDLALYARGMYWLDVLSLSRDLQGGEMMHSSRVSDRYPEAVIGQAIRERWVVEQMNGWFRQPTEKEIIEYKRYAAKRRRAA